jgi:hypothetical protein
VDEQERRPRVPSLQRGDRALEPGGRIVVREPVEHVAAQVRAAAQLAGSRPGLEPLPDVVDRGQPVPQVLRQQQVLDDDLDVGLQRLQPVRRPRPDVCAQPLRAHVGDRLDHGHPMAALEQREQAPRMVPRGRQLSRLRLLARELRGDRLGGEVVHGRRVAVPGGRAREPREVREQVLVDRPARTEKRRQRQLVEDDVDDRRRRAGCRRRALSVAWEKQTAHRRDDEEEHEHDERRRREHRQERLHAARPRIQRRGTGAQRERDGHRGGRAVDDVAHRRQQQRRDDQRDEYEHRPPAGGGRDPPQPPDHRGPDQRRQQRVAEREQQDVPRRAAARDEELRVAAEEIEQRLRERERPQAAEVQRGALGTDRAAHIRGRAS